LTALAESHNLGHRFNMELKFILESVLFSAQKPLNVKEIRGDFDSAESKC